MSAKIHHGDCLDVLPTLPPGSIDACITDPPYEIGFMSKSWDRSGVAFRAETWEAVFRVLKPGAHLVAFGGARSFHRMTCAIEDAGFEIRDTLCWLYGSGFPKSHNQPGGWGTALKPAWEPIILARKPLVGTVAANIAAHGTGAINIEKCRISPSSRQLDEDVCAQLFGLYFSGDRDFGSTSELRGYAQRIELALRAYSIDGTPHEHSAPARGDTTPEDVQAVRSLLSRLRPNEGECVRTNLQSLSSQSDCPSCLRFYDECARLVAASAPNALPSLAGVLADISQALCAPPRSHGCQCTVRLSSSDALMLRVTFFARLIADAKQRDSTYLAPRTETLNGGAYSGSPRNRDEQRCFDGGQMKRGIGEYVQPTGRWPANVAHDGSDEVLEAFAKLGEKKSGSPVKGTEPSRSGVNCYGEYGRVSFSGHADTGTAARFFYCAKASREERGEGNNHPTVKPLALMRWLCRLVTPPGGAVLDPFLGSGSTALAAGQEGFGCVGIEQAAEYLEIARRRLAADAPLLAGVA